MEDIDQSLNTKIRLIILSAYYKSLFTGERIFQAKIPQLEDIDYKIITANIIWLIEHNFLKGQVTQVRIGSVASITRISGKGMDFIENITKESESDLEPQIQSKLKSQKSIKEKSVTFSELLLEGMKLTSNILDLAKRFLGGSQ